jgi:uncharacterized protein (DUF924 family)
MVTAEQVNHFWLHEVEPKAWFTTDPDLDKVIADRFLEARNAAFSGELDDWQSSADGALGLLILLDQFSRNMFRGNLRSFEADAKARDIARTAIAKDFDIAVEDCACGFFYLPFMHAETLEDQDFGIEIQRRRGKMDEDLLHAIAHRRIIEQFGRFPFRNDALGRETTAEEQTYIDAGGYMSTVLELQGDSEAT